MLLTFRYTNASSLVKNEVCMILTGNGKWTRKIGKYKKQVDTKSNWIFFFQFHLVNAASLISQVAIFNLSEAINRSERVFFENPWLSFCFENMKEIVLFDINTNLNFHWCFWNAITNTRTRVSTLKSLSNQFNAFFVYEKKIDFGPDSAFQANVIPVRGVCLSKRFTKAEGKKKCQFFIMFRGSNDRTTCIQKKLVPKLKQRVCRTSFDVRTTLSHNRWIKWWPDKMKIVNELRFCVGKLFI